MSAAVNPLLRRSAHAEPSGAAAAIIAERLAPAIGEVVAMGAVGHIVSAPLAFGDWLGPEREPGACYSYRNGLDIVVAVQPMLAAAILSRRFGGSVDPAVRPALGKASIVAAHGLADRVADAVSASFPVIGAPERRAHSGNLAEAKFARAKDSVIAITFSVAIAPDVDALLRIALPVSACERLIAGEQRIRPTSGRLEWAQDLHRALMDVRLNVRAVLARPELNAATVARLAPGDVFTITRPSRVPLLVGDRRLAFGTLDEADGCPVIRIDHLETAHHG